MASPTTTRRFTVLKKDDAWPSTVDASSRQAAAT